NASGYRCVREQTKASLEQATRATSFRGVGWDFRAALCAIFECADHYGRVARALPLFYCVKSYQRLRRNCSNKSRSSSSMSPGGPSREQDRTGHARAILARRCRVRLSLKGED